MRSTTILGLMVALVASLLGASAAAQASVSAEPTVSCLAGNGRIDVDIANGTELVVEVEVALTGLAPRVGAVGAQDDRRFTITGRSDRDYELEVRVDGELVLDETVTVACDPPAPEVAITDGCIADNGRIDVALNNDGLVGAQYEATIGTLAPRMLQIPGGATGRITATGRPDGPLTVVVRRDGAELATEIVDIACDAGLGEGVDAVVTVGCLAENGRFDIDVQNHTQSTATFTISVTGLAEREKSVAAQRSARFTVTGRSDGVYDVSVARSGDQVLLEQDLVVICDPSQRLVAVSEETVAHDSGAFTQGLLINDGVVFESTGAAAGSTSTVREVDFATGEVLRIRDYGTAFFGEGLSLVDGRLYFLSWREGVVRVLDQDTFESIREFTYAGEGWGLCYDGEHLVMSNGSSTLVWRDPETFEIVRSVDVTLDGAPVVRLNELECVAGQVWSNVWLTNDVVVIDPATGAVVTLIDASGVGVPRPSSSNAVLNGIAYDATTGSFWFTGKLWPALHRVLFTAAAAS